MIWQTPRNTRYHTQSYTQLGIVAALTFTLKIDRNITQYRLLFYFINKIKATKDIVPGYSIIFVGNNNIHTLLTIGNIIQYTTSLHP